MRLVLRLAPVLLIIAVCAAVAAPLAAQDSDAPSISFGRHKSARYSLRGTLRDATNARGLDGVKVDLHRIGGPTVATAFTGAAGQFNFDDLTSGMYEIVANETGYEPVDEQISVEDSVFGLQISVRKLNAPSGESAGPVVSVRELSIPRKAHELMQKGLMLLYQNSDYRGSITQFQRAIKEYPGYYEAYSDIGVAYMRLGDVASSEEALRKSIDVSDQHYADAYFVLANLYVNAKRFADAEPAARKDIQLDDTSGKGHFELASALYGLNRDDEAETEAQAAEQLQPDVAETHLLLANIHIRQHKYPAVLEDVNAYLKLEPNGASADQARHLRDQIQTVLEKVQAGAQAESDDSDSDAKPAEDEAPDPH
jgi:cytochrome c-type biogenesis protein CcmH/NrfG